MVTVALGCQLKLEPEDSLQQLGPRARVLAIQSDPPDLVLGEAAQVRALVHRPVEGRCDPSDIIEYSWSWCPLRDGDGLECAIDEDTARDVWAAEGGNTEFLAYDLGSDPEPFVEHLISESVGEALCRAHAGSDGTAMAQCLERVGVSVRLTVRDCGDEDTAIWSLPLTDAASNRNSNPDPSGTLSFRVAGGSDALGDGEALLRGENYVATAEFDIPIECSASGDEDPCQAELVSEDEDPRREELTTTWFFTHGSPFLEDVTQGAAGLSTSVNGAALPDPRESYVVLENEDHVGAARAYLLVRDERGGVGWATHDYRVVDPL
ncbi:MAG: hypothetical protein ACRBN8_09245 [Nannocystales bacterium]